jgi:hypothetical protein
VATAAVLLFLRKNERCPKLGAYPNYGEFTLLAIRIEEVPMQLMHYPVHIW